MPDGFPNEPEAWAGSTLGRWNFAFALTENRLTGTAIDWNGLEATNPKATASAISGLSATFDGTVPEAAALALCSPEFQWR
jgi:hypothetical protein